MGLTSTRRARGDTRVSGGDGGGVDGMGGGGLRPTFLDEKIPLLALEQFFFCPVWWVVWAQRVIEPRGGIKMARGRWRTKDGRKVSRQAHDENDSRHEARNHDLREPLYNFLFSTENTKTKGPRPHQTRPSISNPLVDPHYRPRHTLKR